MRTAVTNGKSSADPGTSPSRTQSTIGRAACQYSGNSSRHRKLASATHSGVMWCSAAGSPKYVPPASMRSSDVRTLLANRRSPVMRWYTPRQ